MEDEIIEKAKEICRNDFMQYTDFDESIELGLLDALTIMVSEHLVDESTEKIYDFLSKKFAQ